MDSGEGKFVKIEGDTPTEEQKEQFPNFGGVFSIGELIQIKESLFKVVKITRKKLTLRLLKHLR